MLQVQRTGPKWCALIGFFAGFAAAAANPPDPSAIFLAAERGDLKQYRSLKAQGADLNAINERGYTLLHLATQSTNRALVEEMLDDGASMTAGGTTVAGVAIQPPAPLVLAAEKKDWRMAGLLLDRGANPNIGMPGDVRSVGLYLLDHPGLVPAELLDGLTIDPDFKQPGRSTPLGYALEIGDPEMVERYLSRGARLEHVEKGSIFRACAIDLAFDRYHRMVTRVLAASGNDRRFLDGCLLGAVTGDHVDRVADLLQRGAPVKNALLRDSGWERTPLETAITYKRFGIAIELINAGARSDHTYLSHWNIMDRLTAALDESPNDRQRQQVALLLLAQPTVIARDSLMHPDAKRSLRRLMQSSHPAIRRAAHDMVLLDRASMQRIPLPP